MTRRNGKPRHVNVLVRSSPDDTALGIAVESRYRKLCRDWQRIKGLYLVPPPSLASDLVRWRTMVLRHRSGDLRHTEAEIRSTRAIAEWTLRVNAELRGQKVPTVNWR